MAKYIKIRKNDAPPVKKAVCEVCGKCFEKMTAANACEAGHFFNREKPKREAEKCEKTKAFYKEI